MGSLRLKLLIEVDGMVHNSQKATDANRTKWLEHEGYRVIRFSNLEVTTDVKSVLAAISLAIENQSLALGLNRDTPPRR